MQFWVLTFQIFTASCYHFSRARDPNFLVAAEAPKKVESQLPGLTRTEEEKGLLPLRKLHSFQSYHFSRARDST